MGRNIPGADVSEWARSCVYAKITIGQILAGSKVNEIAFGMKDCQNVMGQSPIGERYNAF